MKHAARSTQYAARSTQHGYTLPELLVVIALLALVTGVLSLALYQFYTVTSWGNAQLAVDADLRNAGLWLMRDGNQAWDFSAGAGPIYGTFAITTTDNTPATATYRYDAGATTLWRDYQTAAGTTSTIVARRIRQESDVSFTDYGRTVRVQVISTSGNVSGSAIFTVTLRVE